VGRSGRHALNRYLDSRRKRALDLAVAGALLVVSAPIQALAALAIRLESPGHPIYKQGRVGRHGHAFEVYKLRTMVSGAEHMGAGMAVDEGDARITRVGAILRRMSIDELPNVVNVLRGEMSLVGPRPHAVEHNKHFAQVIDEYLGRHRVKPGITGWAQVSGLRGETRSEAQMRLRVQYDLHYIDNWSLWLDLRILLLTVFVGFVHENAY